MQILKRACTLSAVLLALAAGSAAAQHAQTRDGFFVGVGLGYGSLDINCEEGCEMDREGGLSGYLKLGGAVRENLLLGVETNSWYKAVDEGLGSVTVSNLAGAAYWYPKTQSGFYLKGGVGISAVRLELDGFGSDTETGLGLLTGIGYDWRISRNASVAPTASFYWGKLEGGSTNVLQLGMGIMLH